MTAAHIHEAALLLLLCIGLAFKLALTGRTPPEPAQIVSGTFTEFLEAKGFTVAPSTELAEFGAIHAEARDCTLLAMNIAPQGWQRDMVRSQAERDDTLLFVFEGIAYPRQPVLLTWLEHYRARLVRSLQMTASFRPVVAIVASPECDVANMNWPKLKIDN